MPFNSKINFITNKFNDYASEKVSEGKTKDVAIIDVTPENYIVPDNEKHLYHCVIEIKKFDSETGKRLSIPPVFRNSAKKAMKIALPRI